MKKRLLSLALALLLLISSMPYTTVLAAACEHTYTGAYDTACDLCGATRTVSATSGTTGELSYTITPNADGGAVTITKCETSVTGELEIPATIDGVTVTTIGTLAFKSCKNLTSVVLPEGLTTLEQWAFYSCTGMTKITIPLSLTTVANAAFDNCRALTEVWYNGVSKEYITIGTGNSYFVDAVWYGNYFCDHEFDGKYDTACEHCGATKKIAKVYGTSGSFDYVITPDENGGFVTIAKCNNKIAGMVEIPATIDGAVVKVIGETAFKSCKAMTNVIIPEGVTTLGPWAFYSCTVLTGVTLPTTLTTVTAGAFENCRKLVDVWYYGEDKDSITIGTGNEKLLNATWYSNDTCEHEYSGIYDSVCDICGQKRNIAPVTGTYGVLSYTIQPDGEGGGVVITLCDAAATGTVEIPATIEGITVKKIGATAFSGNKTVTSVIISEGVTTIDQWAFYSCTALKNVTLPATLVTVIDGAFDNCRSLSDVWYNGKSINDLTIRPDNTYLLNATWDGDILCLHAYTNQYDTNCDLCDEYRKITAVTGTYGLLKYTIVPDGNGGSITITGCDSSATGTVVIPSMIQGIAVKTIGETAFKGCKQMTGVVIPENVTTIVLWAFYNCSGITNVTLPNSLTTVGDAAFVGCTKLATVYYNGESKDNITIGATDNKKLLNATWYYGDVCESGHTYDGGCDADCNTCGLVREAPHEYAGKYDTLCGGCGEVRVIEATTGTYGPLTYSVTPDENGGTAIITACDTTVTGEVVIPGTIEGATVTTIRNTAFKGCKQVTSIVIGEGVTTIEQYAFYYVSALTTVTLPASLTTVEAEAFIGCNKLANVYYAGTSKDDISIGTGNTKLVNATWHLNAGACAHEYDNACDADCNLCGETRVPADHAYDNACDTDCNECGTVREVGDHVYDNDQDTDCNECGETRIVAPSFVVSTVEGGRGDTVKVTVSTVNNPGIVSLLVKVGYDANVMELQSIEGGAFTGVSFGPTTNNPIAVNWVDAINPNNTTDGVVATLTFVIKDDAALGTSAITVTHTAADVYDYEFVDVEFADVNGSVTVVE